MALFSTVKTLERWARSARLGAIGRPSPGVLWILRFILGPFVRAAFRPTLDGIDNLPQNEPYLLVANHSGAMAIAEIGSIALLYIEKVGLERPLAGFAFPTAFHVWPASWLMRGIGAIPSSAALGEEVLRSGVPLLVFPGGDVEATRPIWKASVVDFGGRVGFLKLARKAGVPIVPMGFSGSHFTAPILWQARGIARWPLVVPLLARVKYWPVTFLGVAGAIAIAASTPTVWGALLAWLWIATPLSFLPWVPWTVRARIGEPLRDLPEDLPSALAVVEARVRALSRASLRSD